MTTLLFIIYLCFISLGLPDAVLGSAWPILSPEMGVPLSYMGIISAIISAGTISSSLHSHRLINKIGVVWVVALSTSLTVLGLYGFGNSDTFLLLCLSAIPYGLGAGSVDAALNNFVALHFESRHMSWLHCMWGLGAAMGPYTMSWILLGGGHWSVGYLLLAAIQGGITLLVISSRSLWNRETKDNPSEPVQTVLSLREVLSIPGVKQLSVTFFCYCSLEQISGLWATSFFVYHRAITPELATSLTALYYLGITFGRGICGFFTLKWKDEQLIRGGFFLIACGIAAIFIPYNPLNYLGLLVVGLGSSPIYPCIIHSIPTYFGATSSQAITGIQMASAYTGCLTMPFLFGLLANHISVGLFPIFLLFLLLGMLVMYQSLQKNIH
ncbi:MAG: MFS transporter [Eubacteriales bacterium]